LPRRNHGGPAVTSFVPSIKPRVSTPPPPPPAAFRNSRPPRLSVPPADAALELALLPQWEDANASLRPAPKKSKGVLYWIGSTTVSIAVGALVAASLMNTRSGDLAQILPRFQSDAPRIEAPIAPVAEIAPVQAPEIAHSPEIQTEVAAATQQPVVIDELTVTSNARAKAAKPSKRAKPAARAARSAAPVAAQPDPREEVEAEAAPVQAEVLVVTEAPAAEVTEAAAPEAPEAPEASEPAAPALPEKLTRDQVRNGLDALRSQVLQCANGTYGRVLADVTISAPGRVSHAVIEGTFAGTNAGSCMARALRSAKFPAFSGEDISVRYPFSF
jgi:hypothetical protein